MMVSIQYIDHKNCWIQSIKTKHLPTKRGIISKFAIPRDLKGAVDLNAVLSTVSFLDGLSLLDCLDLELFLLMVIDDFSFFNFPLFEELFCFIVFSFFLLFSDSLIVITEVSSNHTETFFTLELVSPSNHQKLNLNYVRLTLPGLNSSGQWTLNGVF